MNKILHRIGAMLMLSLVGMPLWALTEQDGVYQIATAADLVEFAGIVNDGATTANAVLTADISYTENLTSIGANGYDGTFDGQGHTITLEADFTETSTEHVALFYQLNPGGVIKNLNVTGTLKSAGKYLSGIVARLAGGTVSHCVSTLTLYTTISGDCTNGGITGHTVTNNGSVIEYCVVGGAFQGEFATNWGGFVGWADKTVTIDNCIFVADVSGSQNSEQTWARNSGSATVTNSIYLNVLGSAVGGTQVTEEQMSSGEACYILNGRSSTNPRWFQNIGSDPMPVPDSTHGTVYLNGRLHCDGTAYEGVGTYSNSNSGSQKDDHEIVDGVCSYCHTPEPSYMTADADGYYSIATPAQLVWFASMVNIGNTALNARLTAPIDLSEANWTPIGNTVYKYAGVFDGQLYPVTNINGMFFGTVAGAQINGIAIESGEVTQNVGADHTGSIIGHSSDKNTQLTNSYSKAYVKGGNGDLGGIAGKYVGSMKNVLFAGGFDAALSTWSMGGMAGSTNSDGTSSFTNCITVAEWPDGLDAGYGARGGIVGWCHTNTSTNCYVISDTFTKLLGDGTGSTVNCSFKTAEEFADGTVAWALNGESFADVTWYQTLGTDEADPYPVLLASHEIVYPTTTGFASAGASNFDEMRTSLIQREEAYCEAAVAYAQTKADYMDALQELKAITDRDAFILAFEALKPQRAALEASEKNYADFIAFVDDISKKAQESTIGGPAMEDLIFYLTSEWEPDEDYPNGSYSYILANMLLNEEQLEAEKVFVDALWQTAQREGYIAGDEITDLLVNANLANKFNGWEYTREGSIFTTGGVPEVMPTAESWNATFDLHQTLTGLSDGYYKLQVNAAFRPADDIYSKNYAAWIYLNQDETYVAAEADDVVTEANAIDLENCYINGGTVQDENGHIGAYDYKFEDLDNEIFGYVPYGPLSCSYAFHGGRYVNTIVAKVTDGELTVGLKLPGTGCANDWMGFGNFRLFYLGDADSELTKASYDETLAGMVARANAILAYTGSAGSDFKAKPEFAATLRSELQAEIADVAAATTTAQKEALAARFTQTFRDIYDCKQAYVAYFDRAQNLSNTAFALGNDDDPEFVQMLVDYMTLLDEVIGPKWISGAYSKAEAEEMAEMKATALYQYIQSNTPDYVDGKYQIASAKDLQWLARMVNSGNADLSALLVAPIDLAEVEWTPIGTPESPFTGTFDGQLQPISNISNMLFGTTRGATITGVALVSGSITLADKTYAEHSGTIIGHATTGAPTTLTHSYSLVNLTSTTNADAGGLAGKFYGTIENCFYSGAIDGANTVGGLIGSSSEAATPANLTNCFSYVTQFSGSGWYKDGLVGWHHSNGSMTNCFAIAGVGSFGSNFNSPTTNTRAITKEEFASGQIAFEMGSPVWFQTLGEDPYPVLDATHLVVLKTDDGTFYNDPTGIESINNSKFKIQMPASSTTSRAVAWRNPRRASTSSMAER